MKLILFAVFPEGTAFLAQAQSAPAGLRFTNSLVNGARPGGMTRADILT